MKDIFDKMSETHKPCAGDFVKDLNIPTIDLDSSRHIMLVGKSRVGKTCFLNNLIMKHFAHWVYPWNIVVMSPTYHADDSTIPLRDYMFKHWRLHWDEFKLPQDEINVDGMIEVYPNNYTSIRVDIIAQICKQQKRIKAHNDRFRRGLE